MNRPPDWQEPFNPLHEMPQKVPELLISKVWQNCLPISCKRVQFVIAAPDGLTDQVAGPERLAGRRKTVCYAPLDAASGIVKHRKQEDKDPDRAVPHFCLAHGRPFSRPGGTTDDVRLNDSCSTSRIQ